MGQYATSGIGMYKSDIFWLVWNDGGSDISNGHSQDFALPDGSTLTATFSNVGDANPDFPRFWTHESYSGNKHDDYYHIRPDREDTMMIQVQSPNVYTMTLTLTRSGGLSGLPLHLVYADAEDNKENEYTQATTDGDDWQFLELMNYSSTATIKSNNQQAVAFRDADKTLQQRGVFPSECPGGIYLTQNASTLDIELYSPAGFSGMAFGIWFPFDYGDAEGYGTAAHFKSVELTGGYNPSPGTADTMTFTNFFAGSGEVTVTTPGLMMGGGVTADLPTNYNDNASADDSDGSVSFVNYDGSGTYEAEVTVTNITGSAAYLVGYMDFNHDGDFEDGNEQSATVVANSSGTYTVTFTGVPQEIFTEVTCRFRLSSNQSQVESPTGFAIDGEVEDYKIAEAVFPVSLISFEVRAVNGKARLRWATDAEVNSSHFDVQRSVDGNLWQNLSQVPAQGNSAQIVNYESWDDNPMPDRSYYRLRQVDLDGQNWYSALIEYFPRQNALKVWGSEGQISLNTPTPIHELSLYDLSGRRWSSWTFPTGLTGFKRLSLPDGCPDHVYLLISGQHGTWREGRKLLMK